jgi:hypothetical protein
MEASSGDLQVEYHIHQAPDPQEVVPRTGLHIMRALLDKGLRVFNVEPNYWCGQCCQIA